MKRVGIVLASVLPRLFLALGWWYSVWRLNSYNYLKAEGLFCGTMMALFTIYNFPAMIDLYGEGDIENRWFKSSDQFWSAGCIMIVYQLSNNITDIFHDQMSEFHRVAFIIHHVITWGTGVSVLLTGHMHFWCALGLTCEFPVILMHTYNLLDTYEISVEKSLILRIFLTSSIWVLWIITRFGLLIWGMYMLAQDIMQSDLVCRHLCENEEQIGFYEKVHIIFVYCFVLLFSIVAFDTVHGNAKKEWGRFTSKANDKQA